jgi:hypothetical protein
MGRRVSDEPTAPNENGAVIADLLLPVDKPLSCVVFAQCELMPRLLDMEAEQRRGALCDAHVLSDHSWPIRSLAITATQWAHLPAILVFPS